MPVCLPDCLDIAPQESLFIDSPDERDWRFLAGDYPVHKLPDSRPLAETSSVLMVVFAHDMDHARVQEQIRGLQYQSVRKLYLVFQASPRFALFHFLGVWARLRPQLPGQPTVPPPVLVSPGGCGVVNWQLAPSSHCRYFNTSAIGMLKSRTRYWLALVRIARNIDYIIVDVSGCLN